MFEDETSKIVQRHVAMSRVGDTKQYVQDLLLKDQTFVYDVIANRKGQIYLCGKVIKYIYSREKTKSCKSELPQKIEKLNGEKDVLRIIFFFFRLT